MQLNENTCVQIYYKMILSRQFEEMCVKLKDRGLIDDDLRLSYGREGTAAAVCALRMSDIIFTSHRSDTIALAANVPPEKLFAELFGLPSGVCEGKSGLLRMCYRKNNLFGAASDGRINLGIAAGCALAEKIRGTGRFVACFTGDGAAFSGSFFETLNFAVMNSLPILFYIENSGYSGKTPLEEYSVSEDICQSMDGLGVTSVVTDGNSPADVYIAVSQAIEYAKQNSAPVIVEARTVSLSKDIYVRGSDLTSDEEIMQWGGYDPVENHRKYMLDNGLVSQENLNDLNESVSGQIGLAMDAVLREMTSLRLKPETEVSK
ncbi:MAG: thiamine pyrophosphate-dependent dehydrogenase E1 component subunit alpha [Eubacteriaceae bacterium]|nr:thiamine pyrophosphate-dependent dehydrogenase E1 component subunit alpha [Eubacteriaceae bacterium]